MPALPLSARDFRRQALARKRCEARDDIVIPSPPRTQAELVAALQADVAAYHAVLVRMSRQVSLLNAAVMCLSDRQLATERRPRKRR